MRPENANPNNFHVEKIIYNHDGFSIAIGTWQEDDSKRFAMRWNGNDESDKGYPSVFNNPMWFQLPQNITGIIKSIVDNCNLTMEQSK